MTSTKNKHFTNMSGAAIKEGYEARVGMNALERAGNCPNLKGHVHELMYCDKFNANPVNRLKGYHAELTKSPTAQMRDVIVKDSHGRVAAHVQLKDTPSSSGAAKTAKQILDKHYSKTRVLGTDETTSKVAEKIAGKTKQQISSSGISSETTSRVANKALGKVPTIAELGSAARSGGVAGAAVGAGIEAVSSIIDVVDGKKDVGDAVIDIAGAGIKGGVTGAASAAAGSAAAGATGAAIAAATSTSIGGAIAGTTIGAATVAAAPLVLGFGVAGAIGSFISSIFDDL